MPSTLHLAAVDLGASSGRVMLARFDDDRLTLEEIHRFWNGAAQAHDHLYWDALRLFEEIKTGLAKAGRAAPLASLGLDTWGVDFALLDREDELVGNPFHYRDPRTNGVPEEVSNIVGREEIFARTGIQFMQINSLYQLFAMRSSSALERAACFLMIPDLFNFWLTGRKANEYTNASTTQFLNAATRQFDRDLLGKLGLPTEIYPEIIQPGTQLGPLLASVAETTGLPRLPVIAPACHDTGSAVAAAPLENPQSAYISSGTWSLIGVETRQPVITPQSLAHNFTNEGGVDGTFRLLKNVAGMWLTQECRRVWAAQGREYSWQDLTSLAESAPPFQSLLNPDHPDFLNPADMPAAIQAYCARYGQPVPQSHAAILRCIFESLALKYRQVFSHLEELLGSRLETIHIIGGGAQNRLLCQWTADATGKTVLAGPVEATALGNALVQAIALGHLDSLQSGRQLIRRAFPLQAYAPSAGEGWESAFQRFIKLTEQPDEIH